jgi:hypothetical protein
MKVDREVLGSQVMGKVHEGEYDENMYMHVWKCHNKTQFS